MNDLEIGGATVLLGDCIACLKNLPEQSVQMCVTSPPYFGLRDYGHDGQLGLEATPEGYVANMVAVFREVRRVLADDGTLWLNIGDSYANDSKWGGSSGGKHAKALHGDTGIGRGKKNTGLKSKGEIRQSYDMGFTSRFGSDGRHGLASGCPFCPR
jgi:DNA methylase